MGNYSCYLVYNTLTSLQTPEQTQQSLHPQCTHKSTSFLGMLGGQGYVAKLEWSYAPYPDSHHSRQPPAGPTSNVGAQGDLFCSGGLTHVPKICLHCDKHNSHYPSDCDA